MSIPARIVDRFRPRTARYNPPAASVLVADPAAALTRLPRGPGAAPAAAAPPRIVDHFDPGRLARFNVRPEDIGRTPISDERLSGDGGAEPGARQPRGPMLDADPSTIETPAATRPRRATYQDPLARNEQILRELVDAPPAPDANGRLRSGAMAAFSGPVHQTDSIGNMIGQRIGKFFGGVISPAGDERAAQAAQIAKQQNVVALDEQTAKRQREQAVSDADVALKQANADYTAGKPQAEAQKRADAARAEERRAVISNLRLFKGQRLDMNNPTHAALLQRAADAGVEVDPDGWNSSSSNLVPLDLVDPANPTTKRRRYLNKVTGELTTDAGVSGYVQPIHGDTEMTAPQEHADADRDRAFKAGERQRAVSNDLRRAGLNLSTDRVALARASQDNRLSEQTRAELKNAQALQAQVNKAQADADSYAGKGMFTGDDGKEHRAKWAVQKETDARNRADALKQQFAGTYGYLTEGGDAPAGAAPSPALPRRGAPAAGGGARFTEADVRARARVKGKSEDAAVEAATRAGLLRP